MTGYGRAQLRAGTLTAEAEARSVNGRYLQVRCRLPGELSALEPRVESLVKSSMTRGTVDVSVRVEAERGRGLPRIDAQVLRAYRDALMARNGMAALYPVWGRDTRAFVERFEYEGFRAAISCVDLDRLDASFAGREIDRALLADLPPGVDPCGENGEFHSFVWDGPCFARPVPIMPGETVTRDRFCFRDLLPGG